MDFLTGRPERAFESWHTAGGLEQGFRCWLTDRPNQRFRFACGTGWMNTIMAVFVLILFRLILWKNQTHHTVIVQSQEPMERSMKTWMVWILISWVLETCKRSQHRNCAFNKITQEDYWWKGRGFRILLLTGVLWLRKKWCISCTRSKSSQLQFIANSSWFVLLRGQHARLAIQEAFRLLKWEGGILYTIMINTYSPQHYCFYIIKKCCSHLVIITYLPHTMLYF